MASPLEHALQREAAQPREALRYFRLAGKRSYEVDWLVFGLTILSPVCAALVAFIVARRVASHPTAWTVLILAVGYLLPFEIWQRRRREWRPASWFDRAYWYSFYVTAELVAHLLILTVVLAVAALAAFLVSFPLRLAGVEMRESLGLQVLMFVLAHVGVFVHYRGTWRDFWSYLTSLGVTAAVVGSGPAGLLYAHPVQAMFVHGVAGALKATALGRFTREPMLSKLARLGQVRCRIRLGQGRKARRGLEELMDATVIGGLVDPMASALTLLLVWGEEAPGDRLNRWLAAHLDAHGGWGELGELWEKRFGTEHWQDFCLFFCVNYKLAAAGDPDESIEAYEDL